MLTDYLFVGKPSLIMIDGPLVVVDKKNLIKGVVLFNGFKRASTNLSLGPNKLKANVSRNMEVVQGLIYKFNLDLVNQYVTKGITFNVKQMSELYDIDFKLERIEGFSNDYYEIEGVPQVIWSEMRQADLIPSEDALQSDVRFREDLLWMQRKDKGKAKIAKGKLTKQQFKD